VRAIAEPYVTLDEKESRETRAGESTSVGAIILGGGAGTRLRPLTSTRAKPAVPIGGGYRLIDVPMSNCLNSGINKIYILTQFNSTSLNRHMSRTYNVSGVTSQGFVEVLAASQSPGDTNWCASRRCCTLQAKNMSISTMGPAQSLLLCQACLLARIPNRLLTGTPPWYIHPHEEVTARELRV
jgi:ADP-glucose pyrophosphorylase